MFSKLKSWLIERWEIVVAFFGITFVAFLAYLRSKDQKEILDYTNKSHEKELQVNSNAEKDLVSGIQEINDTEQEPLIAVNVELMIIQMPRQCWSPDIVSCDDSCWNLMV